jgi:crotonobetainyl-CoA:carnitine CoA-transferase CaiB-like acyl-CoA transferase
MASLTGRPGEQPLGPPAPLVGTVEAWAEDIAERSGRLGTRVQVAPLEVLAERAALTGHTRRGEISCGGACHLIRADDGWVAVSLARPDDWVLMAALLERPTPVTEGDWDAVEAGVATRTTAELRERAILLGLPLAVLGERSTDCPADGTSGSAGSAGSAGRAGRAGELAAPGRSPGGIHGIRGRPIGPRPATGSLEDLVVADLSSLWAGPLVGRLLHQAGAEVVKVESTTRPDGARRGSPAFFDLMNAGKASVALDLTGAEGRDRLHRLVARSDLVITSSRPRALEQLGLDPPSIMAGEGRRSGTGRAAGEGPRVWLMISGYGGAPVDRDRVAFGDDAAVAGGLVARDPSGPCFCGDAIADPLCGLAGTDAVLAALEEGGRWLLEASMADIAAGAAGPTPPVA